jgi:hypothetical protein
MHNSTTSVSVPQSISVSLLSLSVTSYTNKRIYETRIVFSNSIVRKRKVTTPSLPPTSGDFSWRVQSRYQSFRDTLSLSSALKMEAVCFYETFASSGL